MQDGAPESLEYQRDQLFEEFKVFFVRIVACLEQEIHQKGDIALSNQMPEEALDLFDRLRSVMEAMYPDAIELFKKGHKGVSQFENALTVLQFFIEYFQIKVELPDSANPAGMLESLRRIYVRSFQ